MVVFVKMVENQTMVYIIYVTCLQMFNTKSKSGYGANKLRCTYEKVDIN